VVSKVNHMNSNPLLIGNDQGPYRICASNFYIIQMHVFHKVGTFSVHRVHILIHIREWHSGPLLMVYTIVCYIICFVKCFFLCFSSFSSVQAIDLSSETELLPAYKVSLVFLSKQAKTQLIILHLK